MEQMLWWHWCVLALPILPNLWAIWHVRGHYFPTEQEKSLWFVLVVFIPVIGGLAYLLAGLRRSRREPPQEDSAS